MEQISSSMRKRDEQNKSTLNLDCTSTQLINYIRVFVTES